MKEKEKEHSERELMYLFILQMPTMGRARPSQSWESKTVLPPMWVMQVQILESQSASSQGVH